MALVMRVASKVRLQAATVAMVLVDGALVDKAARAGDASFCVNFLRIKP